MDILRHDIRAALRALRSGRGITVVAVATLAIGIAAVTTIFSFVNTALFRPPPYPDAHRLFALSEEHPSRYTGFSQLSLESVRVLRGATRSFDRVAVHGTRQVTMTGQDRARQIAATTVDTAVLGLLDVSPQRGRLLSAEEIAGRDPVVLIGDAFWRGELGASESVVGGTIRLDGVAHTIVGVAPPGFGFPERAELWLPLTEELSDGEPGGAPSFSALGRLRRGASIEQARAEVHLIGQQLATSGPAHLAGMSLVVRDGMVDRGERAVIGTIALTFLGAAICVLLIACTNVGNLMLVRAAERRTEMAVRASLGASRARLVRQSLTESVLLGLAAGVAGTLLTLWAVPLVISLVPTHGFPSWVRLGVDARVLAFTFGLSLLAAVTFGLPPALAGSRVDPMRVLKSGSTSTVTRAGGGARRGVVIEMALSVALFVAAVLLWQTHRNLAAIEPGYDAAQVLETHIVYDDTKHPGIHARMRFLAEVQGRLTGHPNVEGVASRGTFMGMLPAAGAAPPPPGPSLTQPAQDRRMYLPANPDVAVDRGAAAPIRAVVVSDEYFRVLGVPVLRGRGFGASEGPHTPPVAVVSQQVANSLWPGDEPLGQQFRIGRDGAMFTVVGVARDVLGTTGGSRGIDAGPRRLVYYSNRQVSGWSPTLLVRARADVERLAPAVLAAIRATDPEVAAWEPRTLADVEMRGMLDVRIAGGLMGSFAIVALVLATIGIYGVLAYGVAERTREIGIRMALGGDARAVIRLIVGQGMRLAGIGLAIGVALALAAAPLLRRFVWGVSAYDPGVFAAVVVVFGGVALLACWMPARRATRVQPMAALRQE